MAHKRMFSRDIVASDAFLDMPASTQALYFHLGMEADDDGFIGNPRRLQKVIGSSDDDMKILVGKKFVIIFPSGVLVVKHHRINNNWDKYNCKRTVYLEELSQLNIKDNKAYTLDKNQGVPIKTDNSLQTVSRIEENRIDKNRRNATTAPKAARTVSSPEVIDLFKKLNPSYQRLFKRQPQHEAGKRLLDMHGLERLGKVIDFIAARRSDRFCPTITTPAQLEDRWAALEVYAAKLKSTSNTGKGIISADSPV